MVDVIAKAKITEVLYAQLSQDGDLYNEIMEICRRENIKSGLVLNIVGGLKKARLSMPVKATDIDAPPGVLVAAMQRQAHHRGARQSDRTPCPTVRPEPPIEPVLWVDWRRDRSAARVSRFR